MYPVKRMFLAGQTLIEWLTQEAGTLQSITQTIVPTQHRTPTNSLVPAGDWNVSCTMWIGGCPYNASINQTGDSISGVLQDTDNTVNVNGTASEDGETDSGVYTSDTDSTGTFTLGNGREQRTICWQWSQ
jgi:hypothetical protein